MPDERASTPASRMMLTALGDAYAIVPRAPTRMTPSPAVRTVENGSPVRTSAMGPSRKVSRSSSATSMNAASIAPAELGDLLGEVAQDDRAVRLGRRSATRRSCR